MNCCEGIMTTVKGTSSWYWSKYKSFTFPRPSISLLYETKGSQSRGAGISIFKQTITVIECLATSKKALNYCHINLFTYHYIPEIHNRQQNY